MCESSQGLNSKVFSVGTEEVKRDTKSLDFGQQHTGMKDNIMTYLCLGMAIGHFLGGHSYLTRVATSFGWAKIMDLDPVDMAKTQAY